MTAQPARWVDLMRLNEVEPARLNPKDHDLAGITASIEHHGLADLMVLDDRTGRLVSGHGRLEVLESMAAAGDSPPDGVDVDDDGTWLIPVVRGWASRSDVDAEAYLAEANLLVELGGWRPRELTALVEDLDRRQALAHLPKTTRAGLDDLRKQLAAKARPKGPQAPRRRLNLPSIPEALLERLQAEATRRGVSTSWAAERLIAGGLEAGLLDAATDAPPAR